MPGMYTDEPDQNGDVKRLSPSCQQIVFEDLSDLSTAKVVVRTCMGDADLAPTVTNHRCNAVTLTPSGLYCDMAMTIASYLWRELSSTEADSDDVPGINVCDLEVHKPLIIPNVYAMRDHWLEMTARLHLPDEAPAARISHAQIECTFSSITPDGTVLQQCGHCRVQYESYPTWLTTWQDLAPAINARIQHLDVAAWKQSGSGAVRLVQRATAYAMFESFVQYTGHYQNMSRVTFDAAALEATSVLDFLPPPGAFARPYHLDGSCHLSGFLCNAVEPDRARNAFISHGVAAVRISPRFDPARQAEGARIRNYVRMHPAERDRTVLQGNVYVLQDDVIVGVWEGVKFKKIPRRVLNVFLPPPSSSKTKA